ncbi:MAG: hypothetical protein FWF03_08795, partial [Defluviitaleaceae bacterium]|nr:hypothetical protein [Defluviitaleaceae bacterium]
MGKLKLIAAAAIALALVAGPVEIVKASLTEQDILDKFDNLIGDINNVHMSLGDIFEKLQKQIDELQKQLDDDNFVPTNPAPTPKPTVFSPLLKVIEPVTVIARAGETTSFTARVQNIGTSAATSVLTQAFPGGSASFAIEILDGTNTASNISENGTHSMKMRVTVDPDTKSGLYTIDLVHYYKDRNANNLDSTDKIFVLVMNDADQPESSAPNVRVGDIRVDRTTINPGDSFNLVAVLENAGGRKANEAWVTVEWTKGDELFLTSAGNELFTDMESGATRESRFSFTTTNSAKGTYIRTFKASSWEQGTVRETTRVHFINVAPPPEGEAENAILDIKNMSSPSGVVSPNQDAAIRFEIVNKGDARAENIRVTADRYNETAIVPKSTNPIMLGGLSPGEESSLSFVFSPTDDSATRSYTIRFLVEYDCGAGGLGDGPGESYSFERYVAINVYNPPDDADDPVKPGGFIKPKMIVSAFEVEPHIVRAGQEFDLSLSFMNTSADKVIKNIKITLEAKEFIERTGAVFTPVGGSNTFYVDEIEPKGEENRTLRMYTVPNADPRTYNIGITFEYQDEEFNEYTEAEQITVTVRQNTRIEITDPYLQPSYPLGQDIYIYFNVINSGRVSLSNLRVRVEGENLDVSQADLYIGNVGRGNQISYSGMFKPLSAGMQDCAIVVFGEDETGEIVEHRHEFTIDVYEMNFGMGGRDDDFDDGFGMPGFDMGKEGVDPGQDGFIGKALNIVKKPYVWGPVAGLAAAAAIVV